MHGAHRHAGPGHRLVSVVALVVALVLGVRIAPAHAEERVAVLTRKLSSSSDRTRLSAVLALAKLGDRAAQGSLVTALRDKNVRVRAVAATALGRLECEAALPALRGLAQSDSDEGVRKAARNATLKIARSPAGQRPRGVDDDPVGLGQPGPGEPRPDLFLLVNSAADDSPGSSDPATRKANAEIAKRVLIARCKADASITSTARDAQRWGLAARHIDLSVTRLGAKQAGAYIEVEAELRLAISDDRGKMLSFLSGGAKVQVPSQKFDARYLPALRREALENAVRGMFGKLLAHLRDPSQT